MGTYQAGSGSADAPKNIESAGYDLVYVRTEAKTIAGGKFTKNKVDGDPKLELTFYVASNDDEAPGLLLWQEGENEGKPIEVNKLVGVGFNTQSKTVPAEVLFLKAILTKTEYDAFLNGESTPDDEEDAPRGLVGRVVQGEVFIKDSGWPGIGALFAPKGGQKGKPYTG
jgi:hypothetical protein